MFKRLVVTLAALSAGPAAAWAQVRAGGEFQVNTYTTHQQLVGYALAVDAKGSFVVVWASYGQDGNGFGVFGQRFDSLGTRLGVEFKANTYTSANQYAPAVATDAKGNFIIVWAGYGGEDGDASGVFGQRFDASGVRVGVEFQVNTYTTEDEVRPSVAVDARGDIVVTWQQYETQDGNASGVFGQRFDASGVRLGAEFRVNTFTTNHQYGPSVVKDATGSFVVVWTSLAQDGSFGGVFGQRFDASAARLGTEFQVNTTTMLGQYRPSVATDARGNFVVVWTSYGQDGSGMGVFGQRFDAAGTRLGGEFRVNTYTPSAQTTVGRSVASDENGGFVVTWSSLYQDGDGWGSFGRRFDSSGAPRGGDFQLNTTTVGYQFGGKVGSDRNGNFVVAWSSRQDGSYAGVFGQRFGGLMPSALSVDATASGSSDGNGVLEPGETATVAPSWRNVNGAAQNFAGIASNFSGPPGATYTLADPAANYGTLANGATGSCTATGNCYALGVSNPPTRPAQHWDTTVREDLSPAALGQTKTWTLHVGESYADVARGNPFYRFIETLRHHGVAAGCTAQDYCPSSSTTREQMAVFVLVTKEGAGYLPTACSPPNTFNDVPETSPFCRFIEELARRGVVGGCGDGNYCPTAAVTREQMAIFVLRTLDPTIDPPPCTPPNIFNDVPETSAFCRWIEELFNRGVVGGCGGGNYCPTATVMRDQMGVFLSATFGLTLYGP